MVKGMGKTARASAGSTAAPRAANPSPRRAKTPAGGSGGASGGAAAAGGAPAGGSAAGAVKNKPRALDRRAQALGMTDEEWRAWPSIPPMRTREDYEAAFAAHGTVEEMQGRIEAALLEGGLGEDDLADFRKVHSPEWFEAEVRHQWERPVTPGMGIVIPFPKGGMEARRKAEELFAGGKEFNKEGGAPGYDVLKKHREMWERLHPWGAARFAGNYRQYDGRLAPIFESAGDALGFVDGKPKPVEEVALARGVDVSDVEDKVNLFCEWSGRTREELEWSAVSMHGRRFFWPDEKEALARQRAEKGGDS